MNFKWHPEALRDLEEAIDFYFNENSELEDRLRACVDEAIERMLMYPETWPLIKGPVRRCLVDVFPYSLLYVILDDYLLILACAHHSRHPDYWTHRLE